MATARKLPSGSWRVRIFISGHDPEYVSFTADSKQEAELAAVNYRDNWKRIKTVKNATVGEAIDSYIDLRSAVLSPATIRGYVYDRTHYFQSIMDIKIKNITQADIQRAVNEDAKTRAPKTVRNMHGLLSSVLSEYLPDFKLSTHLPAREKKIDDYSPEDEDVAKLLSATKGRRLHKAIILGACVTMRRSEISALKAEDVDEEANEISIRRAMVLDKNKKWVVKGTKTYESTRVAVVAPEVIKELLSVQAKGEYLVGLVPDSITKQFCALRNKLGIKMRFHDLRSYSASVQHALGVPDKYIMKQGGWSTDYVMKKVYRRAMQKRAHEAALITNKHFGSLLNTSAQNELCDTKHDTDSEKT